MSNEDIAVRVLGGLLSAADAPSDPESEDLDSKEESDEEMDGDVGQSQVRFHSMCTRVLTKFYSRWLQRQNRSHTT